MLSLMFCEIGELDTGANPVASTIRIDMAKVYKIVVKTRNKTFVKKRSKSKKYLEELALKWSITHPTWVLYVVSNKAIL